MKRNPILEHYSSEMSEMAQWSATMTETSLNGTAHSRENHIAFQQGILQALQLPRPYWEVLVLCDVQGHKPVVAAKMLGISTSLAIKRLDRARRLMRIFSASASA
jgi:DNA-directed RNA polymerase specialized sigma24 family protein